MASLSNYLRTHRKRLGLSQDEVALLLGTLNGTTTCRYERFTRVPSLETALALEIILQKPVRELFGGLHQKVEEKVRNRARTFLRKPKLRSLGLSLVLTRLANLNH